MSDTATIERRLDAMERKLDRLIRIYPKPKKQVWVKVSIIKQLTGWHGSEALRKARENGLVEFRKNVKGFEYLLNSLDHKFLLENKTVVNQPAELQEA